MAKTSEYKIPMREIFDGMAKKANADSNALDCIAKMVAHFSGPNRNKSMIWHTAAQGLYERAGGDMYPAHGIGTVFSRLFSRDNKLVGVEYADVDANKSTGEGKAKYYITTLAVDGAKAKRDGSSMVFYDSTNIATLDAWVQRVVSDGSKTELDALADALTPAYEMAKAKMRLRNMLNGIAP